jgi:hypothetical protein
MSVEESGDGRDEEADPMVYGGSEETSKATTEGGTSGGRSEARMMRAGFMDGMQGQARL